MLQRVRGRKGRKTTAAGGGIKPTGSAAVGTLLPTTMAHRHTIASKRPRSCGSASMISSRGPTGTSARTSICVGTLPVALAVLLVYSTSCMIAGRARAAVGLNLKLYGELVCQCGLGLGGCAAALAATGKQHSNYASVTVPSELRVPPSGLNLSLNLNCQCQ